MTITELPIIFTAPMVCAILDNRKTQTRRVVKQRYIPIVEECLRVNGKWVFDTMDYELTTQYGTVGDHLWVRETWASDSQVDHIRPRDLSKGEPIFYDADKTWRVQGCSPIDQGKLRPSIFMMRWMSRITLQITNVRVERLNDISDADAVAEGINRISLGREGDYFHHDKSASRLEYFCHPVDAYSDLWESINGDGSWNKNPWVWVIDFKRVVK